MDTRFRHCWSIDAQWPQVLGDGGSKRLLGEDVPWSGAFARRVFDGEWVGASGGEPAWLTAAIDSPGGVVTGFVQVVPQTQHVGVKWHPPATEKTSELSTGFFLVDEQGMDHPEAALPHVGYEPGEVAANAGRLRLTHVKYRLLRADESGVAENWIIAGDNSARRQTTEWDTARNITGKHLTDYEDVYGLVSDDLWFDYPEFDRYDHLIFRDSPALAKLGVPDEIRLKPIPAMPPEVVG